MEGPTPQTNSAGLTSGLRVLEFTTVVAAPYCGLTLAQYGAQVIRVCAPEPYHEKFLEVNVGADVQRGKENIALDLTSEAGQQRLRELIVEADVIVRNMRPEAAKSLGIDVDSVHAIRPEAIYCSISACRGRLVGMIRSSRSERHRRSVCGGERKWLPQLARCRRVGRLRVGRFRAVRDQPGSSRTDSRAIQGTGRYQPSPVCAVRSARSHRYWTRSPPRARIIDAPDKER